jgi:hypothetical protein
VKGVNLFQVLGFWLIGVITGACGYYCATTLPVLAAEHKPLQYVVRRAAQVDGVDGWIVTPMLPTDLETVQMDGPRTLQKWDVLTCKPGVRKIGMMTGVDGKPVEVQQAQLECKNGVALQIRHLLVGE